MLPQRPRKGATPYLPDCWRKVFQLKSAFGIVAIPGGPSRKERKKEVLALKTPFNFLGTTVEFPGPLGSG